MTDPTQYTFNFKDVTEALIRKQGIKEGVWLLSFQLKFEAGVFGHTEDQARPGALLQIDFIQLITPHPDQPLPPWAVDASKLD